MIQDFTPATRDQVRNYYERQGYMVRIDADGHVEFKSWRSGADDWLEGRWVEEYMANDAGVCVGLR